MIGIIQKAKAKYVIQHRFLWFSSLDTSQHDKGGRDYNSEVSVHLAVSAQGEKNVVSWDHKKKKWQHHVAQCQSCTAKRQWKGRTSHNISATIYESKRSFVLWFIDTCDMTRSCSLAPENMTKTQSCKSHIPEVEKKCGTAQECTSPNLFHLPGHVTESVGLCVHPAYKQDGSCKAKAS